MTPTSKPTLAPPLRNILLACHELASTHGIPLEIPLLLLLGMGSALAGHLIRLNCDDEGRATAGLSFTLIGPDGELPAYFAEELRELERHQDEVVGKPSSPLEDAKLIASLRRQRRILQHLGSADSLQARGIDSIIAANQRRKKYGLLHRVNGRRHDWSGYPQSTTLVVEGREAMRAVLRSQGKPGGYWSILESRTERWTMLSSVSLPQWEELVKLPGASRLPELAWCVASPPRGSQLPGLTAPRALGTWLLKRLAGARFGSVVYELDLSHEAREPLDRQVKRFNDLKAGASPLEGATAPIPDVLLGWIFTGILCALTTRGEGNEETCLAQTARLGACLADWVAERHVSEVRRRFPADVNGPLTGTARSILRGLKEEPSDVRSIQRRLRGVDRSTVAEALCRMVNAKLIIEATPGMFSLAPIPAATVGLSEFLSEFDPQAMFPLNRGSKFN